MGRQATLPACDFWKRLIEAWGERGLPTSQNGVAAELGKEGNGTTGRWYSGDALPELEQLKTIAEKGGVTLDWLLTNRLPKYPINNDSALGIIHAGWGRLPTEAHEAILRAYRGEVALLAASAAEAVVPAAKPSRK